MKKLSNLLSQRPALLEQVRLANLAYAFATLSQYADRVARARLCGAVTLKAAVPEEEHYTPVLVPLEGSPAVIEEHFTDEDILELSDVIAFVNGQEHVDVNFRLEEMHEAFLEPLRAELDRAGVLIDRPSSAVEEPRQS